MVKRLLLTFILLLFLIPMVSANSGKITLLAVSESPSGKLEGTTADLFLEIREGQGRVFIESFPLTKIDTQISTRFAKDMACSYLEMDCSEFDFFYTIRSSSPIIGGPSAGGAISVLTASVLLDLDYDQNVSITGTINSGGIIGPVGGVPQKIKAAGRAGITKVLIPFGEEYGLDNLTFGKVGTEPDIVIVSTLDDAMYEFTGRRKYYGKQNFTINPAYSETMKQLAVHLCERANKTSIEMAAADNNLSILIPLKQDAYNLTVRAKKAFENSSYYASASHCFGAGVAYQRVMLFNANVSPEEILEMINRTRSEIDEFDQEVESTTLRTITDLQAYMVVKERIIEARDNLNRSEADTKRNMTGYNDLAFGMERLESARLWADFFGTEGKEFELDQQVLRQSCISKIQEAQERYHYSTAYLPNTPRDTFQEIQRARRDLDNGDYALCLFKASKAKAESDIVLNAVSVSPDHIIDLIDQKLLVAEEVIAQASDKDIFPIVGYSYYEFSKNLKYSDRYSSLLYAEYALELSNFDVYFERQYQDGGLDDFDPAKTLIFLIGFLTGVFFTMALLLPRGKKDKGKAK